MPATERSRSVIPLAASGGQDRLSPYAAMGNQPEFSVDPEGLEPKFLTTSGGAGLGDLIVGFDGGSLGNRSPNENSYSSFDGGIGGGSGQAEDAISQENSQSLEEMIGIAKDNGGTASFFNGNYVEDGEGEGGGGSDGDDDKKQVLLN